MSYFIFNSTTSTQDEVFKLLTNKPLLQKPFIVLALRQTKGRGRTGKKWISDRIGNLYISIGMKAFPEDMSILFPMILPISICKALGIIEKKELTFKWPNDMLLNNKKFAGVLIERNNNNFIIGIGININFSPEIEDLETTSLFEENIIKEQIKEEDLEKYLSKIAQKINNQIKEDCGQITKKAEQSLNIWRKKQWKNINDEIVVKIKEERLFAKYLGIDEKGKIMLQTEKGKISLSYGDVSF